MGSKTKINWTDSTWNPLGAESGHWHCTKVSPACENCYAERFNVRMGGPSYKKGADRVRLKTREEKTLTDPIRWRRPRKVFVCSMTDLFHPDVEDEWLDEIFGIIASCPAHTFQILTKRPERMRDYLCDDHRRDWAERAVRYVGGKDPDPAWDLVAFGPRVLPNVWAGVTVEDQIRADERIPILEETPARIRWLSMEPLLGPVVLGNHAAHIDWVVVGGESGSKLARREMRPEWARGLLNECAAIGTAFWMKQMGGPRGPIPLALDVQEFPG